VVRGVYALRLAKDLGFNPNPGGSCGIPRGRPVTGMARCGGGQSSSSL
jgi:hypothetical protein